MISSITCGQLLYELREHGLDSTLTKFIYSYLFSGKKYCKKYFTNSLHFAIFNGLQRYPVAVCFSERYVICAYAYNTCNGRTSFKYYLFGINSDGKVFINKLNGFSVDAEKAFELEIDMIDADNQERVKTITFYKTKDDEVYRLLGYSVDFSKITDKVIPIYLNDDRDKPISSRAHTRYRVQGDMVAVISDWEDYFNAIADTVRDRVEEILTRVILQRISAVLQDAGITVHLFTDSVFFRGLPRVSNDEFEDLRNKLTEYIISSVDLSDIGAEFVPELWSSSNERPQVELSIRTSRIGFGEESIFIEVRPNLVLQQIFTNKVMMNLKLEKDWRIFRFGRHLVRYYGYPSRFTLITKLVKDIEGNDEYAIPVEIPLIYVSSGEMYIWHPEHGQETIRILEDVAISFVSTNTAEDFETKMNYHALKQLCRFLELKKYYRLA